MNPLSAEEQRYIEQLVRRTMEHKRREEIGAFDTFCEWLDWVGLSWVAVTLRTSHTAWRGVQRLWHWLFS